MVTNLLLNDSFVIKPMIL